MTEYTRSQSEYDLARLRSALVWGMDMSRDPVWKVGAMLVHEDRRRVSMGFNGLVRGVPETAENWAKPKKLPLVRHAEQNAMSWAQFDKQNSQMFVPLRPCTDCLGDMINIGVVRVVWFNDSHHASHEWYGPEWYQFADMIETVTYDMDNVTLGILREGYGLWNTMKGNES